MRARGLTAAVFTASLLVLGWNAGRAGIATSYVDPIGRIQAQDEATYGSSSLRMARHAEHLSDWLTPWFLDRLALYKPPVLYWLSGAAIKAGAPIEWGFRAPSILAGAIAVTLVFLWLRSIASLGAALAGATLLLASHLFFVMSRVGLMDALLASEITLAMYALARDPRLESRWLWVFGAASGAAIMTKSTAGLFPMLILLAYCALSRERPRWARVFEAAAITAAVALPWHLYQLAVHPKWFWNEYILTEQIAWGMGAKSQSTSDGPEYYVKRLLLLDPVLALGAIAALWRTRPRLLIAWIVVVLAGCAAFQYRNTSYLLPVYPALALLAASALPARFGWIGFAAAIALLAGKSLMPGEPWGIPFAPESVNEAQAPLRDYAALRRANDLIIVNPGDQFYSADLDLERVRYLYIDARAEPTKAPLDFEYLGITVSGDQFERLDQVRPQFAQRLREWGIDTRLPIACVILASGAERARRIIDENPRSDFFVPMEFASGASHEVRATAGGHALLLAREKIERP